MASNSEAFALRNGSLAHLSMALVKASCSLLRMEISQRCGRHLGTTICTSSVIGVGLAWVEAYTAAGSPFISAMTFCGAAQ